MIFYFSGTGNSKYVAQRIAQESGDNLISVSDCFRKHEFTFSVKDDELVGFVFPTYFYGVPSIIVDFIAKLELKNYNTQYIYSIATCGQERGNLFIRFGKQLSKKGIKLGGASEVLLPDNYILLFNLLPPDDKQKNMFIEADVRVNELVKQIMGKDLPAPKSGMVNYLKTLLLHPIYQHGRKTKHFYTTDTCNGCKLCEKTCPVDAITIQENRPKWGKEECVLCLACLHRCPMRAIQHKKRTELRGRYVNPNVDL